MVVFHWCQHKLQPQSETSSWINTLLRSSTCLTCSDLLSWTPVEPWSVCCFRVHIFNHPIETDDWQKALPDAASGLRTCWSVQEDLSVLTLVSEVSMIRHWNVVLILMCLTELQNIYSSFDFFHTTSVSTLKSEYLMKVFSLFMENGSVL